MRVYWDTSAAINALVSVKVWDRLAVGEHFTRPHMLLEFFSTMTGRGISVLDAKGQPARFCMTGNDAAAWLRRFCAQVRSVDLDLNQTLDALDKAQGAKVTGGRVYDYGHALAAEQAQADVILTRNTHFVWVLSALILDGEQDSPVFRFHGDGYSVTLSKSRIFC